jgi:tripartite-type tricarboxylate transporter receptor subunit TctC
MKRRALLLGAGILSSVAFRAAAQSNAPPVRLIVGYTPGGPVDTAARLVAPPLAKELGANVVVENKPGANATLAGDLVAKGTPDGTLLWFAASPTVTISPNISKKMPFDPVRDLVPVAPVLG